MSNDFWGEPIYSYSREQAIADGVLVDVSIMAREAGITYPTAMTRRVWDELVVPDEGSRKEGQSEPGRTWDVIWMLRMTIQTGASGSEVRFPIVFVAAGNRRTTVTLKSICGPDDDGSPCITIMFEDED
jgi:type I site-specific restriction endonuclease